MAERAPKRPCAGRRRLMKLPNHQTTKSSLSDLPQILIIDILSRLPARILCKLKGVSKDWLNLISFDSYFRKLHQHRSEKNPLLLSYSDADRSVFSRPYSWPYKIEKGPNADVCLSTMDTRSGQVLYRFKTKLRCSPGNFIACRALICFFMGGFNSWDTWVCNPSTGEVLELPNPLLGITEYFRDAFRIFFGANQELIKPPVGNREFGLGPILYLCSGLGFVPCTKEYKVARVFGYHNDLGTSQGCQILTLSNGRRPDAVHWKVIEIRSLRVQDITTGSFSTVSVNGVIYWLIRYHGDIRILSLDLRDENSQVISVPEGCSDGNYALHLVDIKGFLGLVSPCPWYESSTLDIWMLKSEQTWVKEYSFGSLPLARSIQMVGYISSPLDGCNEEVVLIQSHDRNGGLLYYYNIHTNALTAAESLNTQKHQRPCLYFDNFFSLGSR